MHLEIIRNKQQSLHSTIGKLYVNSSPQCYTLEPPLLPDLASGNGFVCIPPGTYKLTIRWSNEHKKLLPHVEDVPGRTAIEIHIGNFPRDTKGCALVGKTQNVPDFIGMSGDAFTDLLNLLYSGATLRNPDAPEQEQVWDVGDITYSVEQGV